MYEYKFVRLPLKKKIFKVLPPEDYQKIITEEGRRGWRLVQVLTPGIGAYGATNYYELIFEKRL